MPSSLGRRTNRQDAESETAQVLMRMVSSDHRVDISDNEDYIDKGSSQEVHKRREDGAGHVDGV